MTDESAQKSAWASFAVGGLIGPNRRNFDPESPQFTKIAGLADEFPAELLARPFKMKKTSSAFRVSEFSNCNDGFEGHPVSPSPLFRKS